MAQMKMKEIKKLTAYFIPEGFVLEDVADSSDDILKKCTGLWYVPFEDF